MSFAARTASGQMPADDVLILGASGAAGSHLAAALNRRSIRQRAEMRRRATEDQFLVAASEDKGESDIRDTDALARSFTGYRLVYDCLVTSFEDPTRYRAAARNLAIAAAKTGVKVIHISNCWSYYPFVYLPLNEEHAREGGPEWAKRRREGEDALLAAGVAVAHLPELYGPLLHGGLVQRAIEDAYRTQRIRWIGPPDLQREYAFAPDAMEAVVRLSYCAEAWGGRWIVGANGGLSANKIAEVAGKILSKKVHVSSIGPVARRLRELYDEKMRALRDMPDPARPISFDSGKLEALIGVVPASSHDQGVTRTLAWLDRRRLVK